MTKTNRDIKNDLRFNRTIKTNPTYYIKGTSIMATSANPTHHKIMAKLNSEGKIQLAIKYHFILMKRAGWIK